MDRAWGICIANENSNVIGLGFDEGTIVIKMGNDEPIASMKFFEFYILIALIQQWKTLNQQKYGNNGNKFEGDKYKR